MVAETMGFFVAALLRMTESFSVTSQQRLMPSSARRLLICKQENGLGSIWGSTPTEWQHCRVKPDKHRKPYGQSLRRRFKKPVCSGAGGDFSSDTPGVCAGESSGGTGSFVSGAARTTTGSGSTPTRTALK